jgi:alpha-beta hydrolase superfamily lysophospholipase
MTTTTAAPAWAPDTALPGFEAATIALPDDVEGPVVATLVRRRAAKAGRAVLYLHGFIDYFFQAHMAERYLAAGYDFYALDLRKHGRSLRPHQRPNFCRSVGEYYPEIDAALAIIADETGGAPLLLNGHSTGGLIAALYAHDGARRDQISALFLNSPFFAFNKPPLLLRAMPTVAGIGARLPYLHVDTLTPLYAQSVHQAHRGEWDFNLQWKPIAGFPVRAGWVRAIYLAQRRLADGLTVGRPTLVMHSARSVTAARWSEDFMRADAVLNVADMRRLASRLGHDVTLVAIEAGMHDLMLSASPVRERVFGELFAWTTQAGL